MPVSFDSGPSGVRNGLPTFLPPPGGLTTTYQLDGWTHERPALEATQGVVLGGRFTTWDRPDSIMASGDLRMVNNAAAVVRYEAAGRFKRHAWEEVSYGYSAAPTSGRLTIEDGSGNFVFQQVVGTAGPHRAEFTPTTHGTANTALIFTLSAGGPGASGTLSVMGHHIL